MRARTFAFAAMTAVLLLSLPLRAESEGLRFVKAGYDGAEFEQIGIGSWYGPGFHGRQTASGEIFDQTKLTAAHPTLPLHSWIKVTNLTNKRSVLLLVNDRGPYVDGRIVDVSRRAAQLLGIVKRGLAKVRVEVIQDTIGP
ncbi:MAG: septal ring lytic transglycosylase RlpA family protein [Rhodospirillales bacterium]|nr:septal ring lytic transglycosylase RlpA family protein [Rhodospirillales bacterium]